MTERKITLRTSMGWEPTRLQKAPEPGFEGFQYDGKSFPLQFLRKGENVRVAADSDWKGAVVICGEDSEERWDITRLDPGDWLVRDPNLGCGLRHAPSRVEHLSPFAGAAVGAYAIAVQVRPARCRHAAVPAGRRVAADAWAVVRVFLAHTDAERASGERQREPYSLYIDRCATHWVAANVKLADLWHNLQPERQDCLPPKERKSLEKRYLKARDRIWEALGYEWWPEQREAGDGDD